MNRWSKLAFSPKFKSYLLIGTSQLFAKTDDNVQASRPGFRESGLFQALLLAHVSEVNLDRSSFFNRLGYCN